MEDQLADSSHPQISVLPDEALELGHKVLVIRRG
jgi:hypothetical protein